MNSPLPALSDQKIELVSRLTEKERECLRRWLKHQTAKQIAIALGVSHHAVEKRLKVARAKLGVTSSLEAARLFDQYEKYNQSVDQPSDLPKPASSIHSSNSMNRGVLIMTIGIVLAAGLSLAIVSGPMHSSANHAPAPTQFGEDQEVDGSTERQTLLLSSKTMEYKQASDAEIREWLGWIFRTTDRDENGFVEIHEAPSSYPIEDAMGQIVLSGRSAQKAFVMDHDENLDGKVSEEEFIDASFDAFEGKGIPQLPQGLASAR